MSGKFEFSKKTVPNKNGKNIEITVIKAKNIKNLITYEDVSQFVKALEKTDKDITKDLKIVGSNRIKPFTIKSLNEEYDFDYIRNKPQNVGDKLDGFFEIHFIKS